MRKNEAFTLVEIMIVVAIIAVLAAVAVPAFMRARERTRTTKIVETLRVASDAFVMYAADHNGYPNAAGAGVIPTGMGLYLQRLNWTQATPVGGRWQWQGDKSGGTVTIAQPTGTLQQGLDIDSMLDDGNPDAGAFRISNNHWRLTVE